ncbi:MAG: enoyl-CoA hydratase/isomerase family protein [Cenarchaeum sp. SB0663_bin_5]|nr:enoyl-CoA hydratase/isomerase family protein [Cenarchaeum sp. SB0663_bin_5]MYH03874.1 enoyl-CoA hydratase/isomerase family protein [Cenarchaeum sp. SB0675_bin_21]MYL11581.1 enoyl-CoA hydratase/isomerase family protein [Cenarchaeum sp. SB0669_bin_11]
MSLVLRDMISDGVCLVTINRPDKLNAMNIDVANELIATFNDINSNDEIKCVILTGSGDRAFSAGADISYMSKITADESVVYAKLGQKVTNTIEHTRQPVIAAVNGFALGGGCEVAMSCDIRIASEKARLGQPEVTIGIPPGWGGTQRLMRLVGIAHAKDMVYTGRMVKADEALSMGLVNRVVSHDDLMDEVKRVADMICKNSSMGVQMSKIAMNNGRNSDLDTGLSIELLVWRNCFTHDDRTTMMNAFLSK